MISESLQEHNDDDRGYLSLVMTKLKEISQHERTEGSLRASSLVSLIVLEEKTTKTNFDAYRAFHCSASAGLPAPPWAAKILKKGDEGYHRGEVRSLDTFFGL